MALRGRTARRVAPVLMDGGAAPSCPCALRDATRHVRVVCMEGSRCACVCMVRAHAAAVVFRAACLVLIVRSQCVGPVKKSVLGRGEVPSESAHNGKALAATSGSE